MSADLGNGAFVVSVGEGRGGNREDPVQSRGGVVESCELRPGMSQSSLETMENGLVGQGEEHDLKYVDCVHDKSIDRCNEKMIPMNSAQDTVPAFAEAISLRDEEKTSSHLTGKSSGGQPRTTSSSPLGATWRGKTQKPFSGIPGRFNAGQSTPISSPLPAGGTAHSEMLQVPREDFPGDFAEDQLTPIALSPTSAGRRSTLVYPNRFQASSRPSSAYPSRSRETSRPLSAHPNRSESSNRSTTAYPQSSDASSFRSSVSSPMLSMNLHRSEASSQNGSAHSSRSVSPSPSNSAYRNRSETSSPSASAYAGRSGASSPTKSLHSRQSSFLPFSWNSVGDVFDEGQMLEEQDGTQYSRGASSTGTSFFHVSDLPVPFLTWSDLRRQRTYFV